MSRALKFRAWHKNTLTKDGMPDRQRMSPTAWTPSELMDAGARLNKVMTDDDFIFLQFTGLLDAKGREIYEGDVVHFRDWDNGYGKEDETVDEGVGQVKFGHSANHEVGYTHGWFIDIIPDTRFKPFGFYRGIELKEMEIIGNVFENPDLLK